MSYGFSNIKTNKSNYIEEISELIFNETNSNEIRDHLEASLGAISRLVPSLGRDQEDIIVSISGHANKNHEPSDEWADEYISITIQVRAKDYVV